jgi:KaiC/GvpD/RAD55 family RecA-like ATPase
MRLKYPTHQIIIVADNDESGTGKNYADQAAAKYGAQMILIPNKGQDANDYHTSGHSLNALLVPESAGIKALDVISSDDLGDEYLAPDEIVQGLFVAGEISVLYGASNSGKTFLSVAMADAVATGQNFLDRRVDGGGVLYIAAESPASIKVRIQAINKHFGRVVSGVHIAQAQVNLYSRPEFASLIVQAVAELEEKTGRKIKMIIMDTLARITAGANENTGEDMAPILEALDRIAKTTHTALIVIHHSGKDQLKGSRGWSGIYGAVDAEIEVKEENGGRYFRVSKQRQLGTKEQIFGFDLVVVQMGVDKWGDPSSTCVVVPADVEKEDKLEYEKSIFMDCCRHIGKLDEIEGKTFVSGSALSIQLFELGYAKSEASSKQMVKPSASGYLCNKLKEKRIITHRNGGYIIEDQDIGDFIKLGIKGI